MMQHLQHHHLMGDIDWEITGNIRKVTAAYYERLKLMKLIWRLYAFGHVKLFRKHCTAREAMCGWCGKHPETMQHVLHDCMDPNIQKARSKLFVKIASRIAEDVKNDNMKKMGTQCGAIHMG